MRLEPTRIHNARATLRRLRQEAHATARSVAVLIHERLECRPRRGDKSFYEITSDPTGGVAGDRKPATNDLGYESPPVGVAVSIRSLPVEDEPAQRKTASHSISLFPLAPLLSHVVMVWCRGSYNPKLARKSFMSSIRCRCAPLISSALCPERRKASIVSSSLVISGGVIPCAVALKVVFPSAL